MKLLHLIRKKYGIYLLAGIFGVITYILIIQVVIPTATQTLDNYRTWEDKKNQLAQLTKKRAILEGISDATLRLLSEAEAALPTEKDAAGILISMENLAQVTAYGVNNIDLFPGVVSTESANPSSGDGQAVAAVAPDPNTRRKGADFLAVSVQTAGTTGQFLEFIRQVQGSRRIFDIESVNIGVATDSQDQLSAQFSLIAYYLPPITSIGRIDSELPNFTPEEQKLLEGLVSMPIMSATLLGTDAGAIVPVAGKTNLFTR